MIIVYITVGLRLVVTHDQIAGVLLRGWAAALSILEVGCAVAADEKLTHGPAHGDGPIKWILAVDLSRPERHLLPVGPAGTAENCPPRRLELEMVLFVPA